MQEYLDARRAARILTRYRLARKDDVRYSEYAAIDEDTARAAAQVLARRRRRRRVFVVRGVCEFCQREFEREAKRRSVRYCSRDCAIAAGMARRALKQR